MEGSMLLLSVLLACGEKETTADTSVQDTSDIRECRYID